MIFDWHWRELDIKLERDILDLEHRVKDLEQLRDYRTRSARKDPEFERKSKQYQAEMAEVLTEKGPDS